MPTLNQYPDYQPLVQNIRNLLYNNWNVNVDRYDREELYFSKNGDLQTILFYNSDNGGQIRITEIEYSGHELTAGRIELC